MFDPKRTEVVVNTRQPWDNRYVLLRSFDERERHLQELEICITGYSIAKARRPKQTHTELRPAQLNFVQLWGDPLVLRQHAPSGTEVGLGSTRGRKYIDVPTSKVLGGSLGGPRPTAEMDHYIDRPEEPPSNGYIPNHCTVRCRNKEELERHLEELDAYCRVKGEDYEAFDCLDRYKRLPDFTPDSFIYIANLKPEVLEWVKGRDEVITRAWQGRFARLKEKKVGVWRRPSEQGKLTIV
ncbi:hypothetical protein C8F04DRAFT_1366920 [Mycena alexandri]|uniref:Uncharacterized protein n=1 Tax=Mycena alexandri TaxID=1745969 RepID=A0AAD6TEN4_9AGAR|nr:hypothetical protein C8F04DRAFT_1366920 [Mycena alexandri]